MRHTDALKGLFLAFLLVGILGFLIGGYTTIETGERALAGIQGSKNAAGELAGFAILLSFAMICNSWGERAYHWLLLAIFGLATAALTLLLSKATGALIGCVVASGLMFIWLITLKLPTQVRIAISVMAALFALIALGTMNYWLPSLFEMVLETSGKDAGLTGRDILWRMSDQLIAQSPWLGRGYNAFWVVGNLDAEYLWRHMGIGSRIGFNFHNTWREVAVDLGLVGLVLFAVVGFISATVLFWSTLVQKSVIYVFALSAMVYFVFKFPVETFGFGGMHVLSMMLFMVLAMGYRYRRGDKV